MNAQARSDGPLISIVGCGLGGLALAAALLKFGIRVQLFEQAEAFSRVGTGIGLAPNAVKVARGLGLEEQLTAIAYQAPYRTSRRWDTGEEMLRYPVKEEMLTKYGAPYLLLHRGDTHQALYDLLPPGLVRFGHRVQRAERDGAGVAVTFTNGTTEFVDYLVGADGIHSAVRDSVFKVEDARYTGRVAYRSIFSVDLLSEPLIDPDTKWWGPDRHIVDYYVTGGREVYFTTSVPHPEWVAESFSAEGDLEELRAAFEGFHPNVQALLRSCPHVQKWAIYERTPLETWQDGPVVLLGDACHPMTPYMQQGAATAMEDGVVLARCVDATLRAGGDVEDAFAWYVRLRQERTASFQIESAKNRWNETMSGSPGISNETVYNYDAWTCDLTPAE